MENRTCKQCGKEFVITDEEIKFMEGKNLELPKRCKECRKANKAKYRKKKKEKAKMSYEEKKQQKVQAALNAGTVAQSKPAKDVVINNDEERKPVEANISEFPQVENKANKIKKYALRLIAGILLLIVIAFIAGAFSGL